MTVSGLRTGLFQWAVAAFLAIAGALMLVAPHQFGAPGYDALRPYLPWWGVVSVMAGAAVLAAGMLALPRLMALAAHVPAIVALLLLAFGFTLTGVWSSAVNYTVLAAGTLIVALGSARHRRTAGPPADPEAGAGRDLFGLLFGLTLATNGLLLLAVPQHLPAPYDPVRPLLPVFGLLLVASGGALALGHAGRRRSRRIFIGVHLMAAAGALAWGLAFAVPPWAWTGLLYYGGFGLLVALLPWLGPRLHGTEMTSLRARLTLALAAAAAVPLVLAATLVTSRDEQAQIDETLAREQALAAALAQHVADYVGLHRAAVASIAGQSGLSSLSPADQRTLLRSVQAAYSAFFYLATFDVNGAGVARSDERPVGVGARLPIHDQVRRTNAPALDIVSRPELGPRPIILLGAPLTGADGQFAGAVLGAMESTQLSAVLARPRVGHGGETYLVDHQGRLLAHPDLALAARLADASDWQPVAEVLSSDGEAGSMRYRSPNGERLAGFARVPGLGWGVVVEQPTEVVLANTRTLRTLVFGILLAAIVVAALGGAIAAGHLTASLTALARAADALAAQQADVPLPQSRTTEVARLAHAFGQMRDRLLARTAEREQAIRLRDDVLGTVSHDLKNPLSTIRLQAQVLQEVLAEDGAAALDDVSDGLARIVGTTARMQSMIEELVDAARLQSGQALELHRRPLDLISLTRQVVEEYRRTSHRHRLEISTGVDSLIGVWDQARLERVIGNLLSNAIKYSPQGGLVEIRVDRVPEPRPVLNGRADAASAVLARPEGGVPHSGQWAALSVRDEGLGIPAADLPRIAQRFHRAGNVAGLIRGTGIGLSSSGQVVAQHGGLLLAESVEGQGSTFTVLLPLTSTPDPREAPEPHALPPSVAAEAR